MSSMFFSIIYKGLVLFVDHCQSRFLSQLIAYIYDEVTCSQICHLILICRLNSNSKTIGVENSSYL